jgi:hypothetical protein
MYVRICTKVEAASSTVFMGLAMGLIRNLHCTVERKLASFLLYFPDFLFCYEIVVMCSGILLNQMNCSFCVILCSEHVEAMLEHNRLHLILMPVSGKLGSLEQKMIGYVVIIKRFIN